MISHLLKGCQILLIMNLVAAEAYLIGEPCKYDDDCYVEHSYCEMQQICMCKENFIETEDRETCIAMVGAYCHSKYDCDSLPNSICKEDRCTCVDGYVSDSLNSKCMPVAKRLEGPCEHHAQCSLTFGPNSFCDKRQCSCKPGYHFDGYCILNKGLGQICSNHLECFIGNEYKNTITCSGGTCVCRADYLKVDGVCKSNGIRQLTLNRMAFFIGIFIIYLRLKDKI